MPEPEIKPEIKRGGRRPGAGRPKKSNAAETPRRCPQCAVLVAEVAALKRELAARSGLALTPTEVALASATLRASAGRPCIHGAVYGTCRKLGCVAEARRGATS